MEILLLKKAEPKIIDCLPKNTKDINLRAELLVMVKVIFEKDSNPETKTEMEISNEKTMGNLIDMYKKNTEDNITNNLMFLCDGDNIDMEENKNKKIKDYTLKDSEDNSLKIEVLDSKILKKIFFENNINPKFGIYISPEKTLGNLIYIYYKKKGFKENTKKFVFLCNGDKIDDAKKDKKIED